MSCRRLSIGLGLLVAVATNALGDDWTRTISGTVETNDGVAVGWAEVWVGAQAVTPDPNTGFYSAEVDTSWSGWVNVSDSLNQFDWTSPEYGQLWLDSGPEDQTIDFRGDAFAPRIEVTIVDESGSPAPNFEFEWWEGIEGNGTWVPATVLDDGRAAFLMSYFEYDLELQALRHFEDEERSTPYCPEFYAASSSIRREIVLEPTTLPNQVIWGNVYDFNGSGMTPDDVVLDPAESGMGTPSINGNYYEVPVVPGWTGTVVPVKSGRSFVPKFLRGVCEEREGVDFTAVNEPFPPTTPTWAVDPHSAGTYNAITMTVNPSTDPNGDTIEYEYWDRVDPDDTGTWVELPGSPTEDLTYVDGPLSHENIFTRYAVRAVDATGLKSDWLYGQGFSGVDHIGGASTAPTDHHITLTGTELENLDLGESGHMFHVAGVEDHPVLDRWLKEERVFVYGLSPDQGYTAAFNRRNGEGEAAGFYEEAGPVWTYPSTPTAPILVDFGSDYVVLAIGTATNPPHTTYGIHSETLDGWLGMDGAIVASPVWATADTWRSVHVGGLTDGVTQTFEVQARGASSGKTSAFGPPLEVTPIARAWGYSSSFDIGDTGEGRGAAWGDYDGDDDLDLYLVVNGPNKLYRNDDGDLIDVTNELVGDTGFGSMASWGDFDDDGLVDLYLANRQGPNRLLRNTNGTVGGFVEVQDPLLQHQGSSSGASWVDYDDDDDLDLYITNIADGGTKLANALLRNDGSGSWSDQTPTSLRFLGKDTHSATWADYNQDGKIDCYVVNDGANALMKNMGFSFVNVAMMQGGPVGDPGNGRGAAWGDYDNDGLLDLYLTNVGSSNKLLRGVGGPSWSFVDATSGPLIDTGTAGAASWQDFDNDGDLDLYYGHWYGPNRLLSNEGDGSFSDITDTVLGNTGDAEAIAAADYDGDGDVDIYVANRHSADVLLDNRSTGSNHYYHLWLEGTEANESGIGARVRLWTPGSYFTRLIGGSTGFNAQDAPVAYFGLGAETTIDKVQVWWPSGTVNDFYPPQVDRIVKFVEQAGGGGCPYVYTFDGTRLHEENTCLQSVPPTDAGEDRSDVVDALVLGYAPGAVDGRYLLEIKEFEEEHSFFDRVALAAYDHPLGTSLAILGAGQARIVGDYLAPVSVRDQNGREFTDALAADDGLCFGGHAGDVLTLEYAASGGDPMADIIGIISGIKEDNGGRAEGNDHGIEVSVWNGSTYDLVGSVQPREIMAESFLQTPASLASIGQSGNIRLRLRWLSRHDLDFVAIPRSAVPTVPLFVSDIDQAIHTDGYDVTSQLASSDGEYAEVTPGQGLRLWFDSMEAGSEERTFVLDLEGHYYKLDSTSNATETMATVGLSLGQPSPNPMMEEATIRFALPSAGAAVLSVYTAAGRRVATPLSSLLPAGEQLVHWDGTDDRGRKLAPGVYFFVLRADGRSLSSEVTILR